MTLKGVIFDIDGTLADTLAICTESYVQFLEKRLGRPVPQEEVTQYFGMNEEGILARFLDDGLPEALDEYFRIYEQLHVTCKEPFPGIREALELLLRRNVPMAVVTGKGARGAEITLRELGLEPYFSVVETNSGNAPDKPEKMRIAAQKLGIDVRHLIYVGDTPYDMQAAASVGVFPIGAAWADSSTLKGDEPEALHIFHRIEDFTAWISTAFEHKEGRLRDNRFAWRFPSTI